MVNIIFEHLYTVEGYVTFAITVVSGKFSGASNFCISENSLADAVLTLREIYNKLSGEYQMNDYNSDDFILFEFEKYGHLKVSGQVGGSHRQQYLVYQFMTDQTVLAEIISSFRSMT